jgi:hypothetical protein
MAGASCANRRACRSPAATCTASPASVLVRVDLHRARPAASATAWVTARIDPSTPAIPRGDHLGPWACRRCRRTLVLGLPGLWVPNIA